jgi:hypothetical protein
MTMQTQENQLKYEIQFPGLPLAVYREIAAHLRQVEGVETGICPAPSHPFDYNQSQAGGLWIQYAQSDPQSRERVAEILAYYQNRYGA